MSNTQSLKSLLKKKSIVGNSQDLQVYMYSTCVYQGLEIVVHVDYYDVAWMAGPPG